MIYRCIVFGVFRCVVHFDVSRSYLNTSGTRSPSKRPVSRLSTSILDSKVYTKFKCAGLTRGARPARLGPKFTKQPLHVEGDLGVYLMFTLKFGFAWRVGRAVRTDAPLPRTDECIPLNPRNTRSTHRSTRLCNTCVSYLCENLPEKVLQEQDLSTSALEGLDPCLKVSALSFIHE